MRWRSELLFSLLLGAAAASGRAVPTSHGSCNEGFVSNFPVSFLSVLLHYTGTGILC